MAEELRRYAVVGTGGRASMYIDPIVTRFRDNCELVAICDTNPGRLEYHNCRLETKLGYHRVPSYGADDFDRMVKDTRPDVMIVCTVDAYHHTYLIRAMELGCDTIVEKPMTTDAEKCRYIMDAVNRTGRNLRVIFNYRWVPGPTTVKDLISAGTIGEIIHVNFEYMLNTSHGADYFRRWHREKDKSGGLMVHKATHHFDLVNWWVDAVADTVFGFGSLAFYGKENAKRRGIEVDYDRYLGIDTKEDPFALDLSADSGLRTLYLDTEKHDGYWRDRNVFGQGITIEDTMSVLVKYRTGVILNYSLNAYLPREGCRVSFNGTKGRIEYEETHNPFALLGQNDKDVTKEAPPKFKLMVYPIFGKPYEVMIPEVEVGQGHGGSDVIIQEQIFSPDPPRDDFGRNAAHGQGAASVLIGVAANESFQAELPVRISELCPQLSRVTRLSELP